MEAAAASSIYIKISPPIGARIYRCAGAKIFTDICLSIVAKIGANFFPRINNKIGANFFPRINDKIGANFFPRINDKLLSRSLFHAH